MQPVELQRGALMPCSTLPAVLGHLIEAHGKRYAPHYPPAGNADHGPMAFMALHSLGMDVAGIEQFAAHYQRRLIPQEPPVELITQENWRHYLGRREAYAGLREFFAAQVDGLGWQEVLTRYLPGLVSGWVKDAFHPLIRLAYGIEFRLPSEIASGLAYLSSAGNDSALAALAERSPAPGDAGTYLASLQSLRNASYTEGRFNARYRAAAGASGLRPAGGRPEEILRDVSRSALEIFHSTHDFFALHLVTSSHAFRVCAPWAGPGSSALFSVGIGAAYLGIGAPPFAPLPSASAELPLQWLAADTDEHDIKIAYSALMQSSAYEDPTYRWVAMQYLGARHPVASEPRP